MRTRWRWREALTLVSAIVCVGSLALVARSFVRADIVTMPFGQNVVRAAITVDGKLLLWRFPRAAVPNAARYFSRPRATERGTEGAFWVALHGSSRLGIGWGPDVMMFPLWLVPILCAIAPLRWWRRRSREGGRGFAVTTAASVDNDSMIR